MKFDFDKFVDITTPKYPKPPPFCGYEQYARQKIDAGALIVEDWIPPRGANLNSLYRGWKNDSCYDFLTSFDGSRWTLELVDFDWEDGKYEKSTEHGRNNNTECTVYSLKIWFSTLDKEHVNFHLVAVPYHKEHKTLYPEFQYKYRIDTTEEQYFQRSLIDELDMTFETHSELIKFFFSMVEKVQNEHATIQPETIYASRGRTFGHG